MRLNFRIKHHFFSAFRELFVHHHGSLEFRAKVFALVIAANEKASVENFIVVKDIASGLKEDRRGLRKLIEMARKRQIDAIIVAYKDRLTRFGFTYLKELFEAYGVRVIVAFHEEPKDYYQELIEDLIAIVTSFAGRIYGKRSHKYKKVVRAVEEAVKDP